MIVIPDQGVCSADRLSAPIPDPSCRFGTSPVPVEAALHLLIDNLEQGVAIIDRSGRAQFLNRTVQTLIRKGLMRFKGGCLYSGTPDHGAMFSRFIARCAIGASCSVRLVGDGGTLLIAGCLISRNTVLLRIIDPASTRLPSTGVLQDQFGFTPAEAALATDLLAGNDITASAAHRRISPHTARAHLRRLFEKTGTRRQAELMRLLLLCPQPVMAPDCARSGSIEF